METKNCVSIEIAKLLKEAGFDWEVEFFYQDGTLRSVLPDVLFTGPFEDIKYYYEHIGFPHRSLNYNDGSSKFLEEYSAPTLDVAQRWLREVKNIQITISPLVVIKKWTYLIAKDFWLLHEDVTGIALTPENFDTYELALEAGIKKALEKILKNEK